MARHSENVSMRSPETSILVTVRWTKIALRDCSAYGVSEEALTALLAANPTCGLPKGDVQHLRRLPWAGNNKAGETAALTIWYIYVPEALHVEVIAISEPGDIVSDAPKNGHDAKRLSKNIFDKARNGYLGYRVVREIMEHWHDLTSFLP